MNSGEVMGLCLFGWMRLSAWIDCRATLAPVKRQRHYAFLGVGYVKYGLWHLVHGLTARVGICMSNYWLQIVRWSVLCLAKVVVALKTTCGYAQNPCRGVGTRGVQQVCLFDAERSCQLRAAPHALNFLNQLPVLRLNLQIRDHCLP